MWIYPKGIKVSQVSYWISDEANSFIIQESQRKYPCETGGILVGNRETEKFKIEIAIGPGPNAVHKKYSFSRDGMYAQEQLDQFVDQSSGKWDYLGEWHSHPQKAGPSIRDLDSLKMIARNPRYAIEIPILGLSILENDMWVFYCFSVNS
jgi:integrative and conjugative element protein (TIGR02256 family)